MRGRELPDLAHRHLHPSPRGASRSLGLFLVSQLLAWTLSGCGGEARVPLPEGSVELAVARLPATAAAEASTVRLLGRPSGPDGTFHDELSLQLVPAGRLWPLPSGAAAAHAPRLAVLDVTGDGWPEVVVTGDAGGSGGMIVGAVFAVDSNAATGTPFRVLFEASEGPRPRLSGRLADGFAASLVIDAPGQAVRTEVLDLSSHRAFYVATGAYDEAGTIQRPVDVWGDGVMALEPLPATAPDGPGLRLVQQPRGTANADRLAEVVTILRWQEGQWRTVRVDVAPLPGARMKG